MATYQKNGLSNEIEFIYKKGSYYKFSRLVCFGLCDLEHFEVELEVFKFPHIFSAKLKVWTYLITILVFVFKN